MKNFRKLFALGLCSVFAVSMLAGCGDDAKGDQAGGDEQGSVPSAPNTPETPSGPSLPTPDKQAPVLSDAAATYTVNTSLPTNNPTVISDDLFGVFLEDINYAGYLLDDSVVNNGNFSSLSGSLSGWAAIGGGKIELKREGGVLSGTEYDNATASVGKEFGRVTVSEANGGVSNSGYAQVPIAVKKGEKYTFSAFVKSAQAATLKVSVKDGSTVYATADISLHAKNEWVKYVKTVEATETASENLHLELAFDTAGSYDIDAVALEGASTAGIKQYVFDAVEELAPKFIRFPGGCIIEGDGGNGADTTEVYDWKNSVGAVNTGSATGQDTVPKLTYTLDDNGVESTAESYGEYVTRTSNLDLWGYNMDYGVGFYEYFLLCDSLNASALPVLNCGFSCQGGAASNPQALNGRHGQKVDDYIQDAIDLIEFAKGDKTTKWGAIRAAMGHEEPFKMSYLGIGNEQSGAYYANYYEEFLKNENFKAALEKYSVKPIVGNGMFRNDCEDPRSSSTHLGTAQSAAMDALEQGVINKISDYGVHDQHYYVNYTYLFENYDLYDKYKRESRKPNDYYEVFVGEYSANAGDGSQPAGHPYNGPAVDTRAGFPLYPNSLITALSEAAAMTGFERNGDIVKLAAYAPMFGAVNKSANATSGGDDNVNQWKVDMMYYDNTSITRTANYYVQKIFMHNQGKTVLSKSKLAFEKGVSSTFELPREGSTGEIISVNKLYEVASVAENGDVIVKLVNATGEAVKLNLNVTEGTTRGFAYVTELSGSDYKAMNTFGNEKISPKESSIGWSGNDFGYELKPYSLTVLRIPMA